MKRNQPSVSERMATATKRGYDTGKPSKDIKPPGGWKIKPTGNPLKGKIGIKATKKF